MKRLFQFKKKPDPIVTKASDDFSAGLAQRRSPSPKKRSLATPARTPTHWERFTIIPTEDALFIVPVLLDGQDAAPAVSIAWGKGGQVAQAEYSPPDLDDTASITVRGVVGILTLFSVFDPSRQVFGVKQVAHIPLEHERAKAVIGVLRARMARDKSHSGTLKAPQAPGVQIVEPPVGEHENTGSLHVKWAPQNPPSLVTDTSTLFPPSPSSSGASTPISTTLSLSPLAKTLSDRLSFWKSRSLSAAGENVPMTSTDSNETLSDVMSEIDQGVEPDVEPADVLDTIIAASSAPASASERHHELEEKIVKECAKQFTNGMYFSYTTDFSHSLQSKHQKTARLKRQSDLLSDLEVAGDWSDPATCDDQPFTEPQCNLPLWRRVEHRFCWNEHLTKPFLDANLEKYVLPILQGYFQASLFHIPGPAEDSTPVNAPARTENNRVGEAQVISVDAAPVSVTVEYAIISRRSSERAGLRYQRRGIDEDSNVANFVETETIVRVVRDGRENIFSHVQIRGSIPLYWTQSGYGLKPPPQLDVDRTWEQQDSALGAHFHRITRQYGSITVVNLAEQHGKEGALTDALRERMDGLKIPQTRYHQFDFHAECRGMRYENISKLTAQLERVFEQQGFFWISDSAVLSQQRGVFRVNCIDCLDRTNVVQSAFGREVLSSQLEAIALLYPTGSGYSEADVVFNDLWANNGDAISRAYAGTSALKGDYTRTGKRDLSGLLNDGINSLARVYTSTFSDWFSQAVIDYMLGNRGTSVFAEFLQRLSSTDPRDVVRISKVRAMAIEAAAARVILEEESMKHGWTVLSPVDLNTTISGKFEEKIILMSEKALYIVSYDYSLEKVNMFTRVPLGDLISIRKGAYILSTLNAGSRDENSNYGFSISFLLAHQDTRVSSYSVRNHAYQEDVRTTPANSPIKGGTGEGTGKLSRILSNVPVGDVISASFKAIPMDPLYQPATGHSGLAVTPATTCKEFVSEVVEVLRKACEDFGLDGDDFVQEKDIVGLAEAQRVTSLYAKFEYNFKRLLWLGS